jgi:flagellar basal-body rod protein FlgB
MLDGIFHSTTIPVLEQVAGFAQGRHTVLAGNIANLDTPGYRVRDLSLEDFQTRLKEAIEEKHKPKLYGNGSPGDMLARRHAEIAEVAKNPKTILYHDDSNVGLEFQVTEMVKNHMLHNMALTIMSSQFRLLQAAIAECA